MSFRARIFLATLLPSAVLVSAAAAVAVAFINESAEESARVEFANFRGLFDLMYEDHLRDLKVLSKQFDNARIRGAIHAALETREFGELQKELDYFAALIKRRPDLYEIHTRKGQVLLRHAPLHRCGAECVHTLPEWVREGIEESLTVFDGRPYLAVWKESESAHFILGTDLTPFIHRLTKDFPIRLVLHRGKAVAFSSVSGWAAATRAEGTVRLADVRYLVDRKRLPDSLYDATLLRDMSGVDGQKRMVLLFGTGGLALVVMASGFVSSRLARGFSRPIEDLVEATRKVGEGDYGVQVGIHGRDELARLGRAFNDMTEGLRKRRDIMEKTLSRDVAEELMKGVELGGERREVTILFMDVRGFTSGTQGVDPAEVVAMINDMMERLARAIDRHGGNVNKFLGDGLMAMFGAPKPLEDHALQAIRAAVDMQKEMADWNAGRSARGLPNFNTGIGINTGIVVGGRVGSRDRLEYTLIGEEVNLTSRICGKAAPRQILITKSTYERAGTRVRADALEPVVVKGLSYPVAVYEVTGC